MPRPLDRLNKLPLMSGACSGDALWNDLALFRDKPEEPLLIFIVDEGIFTLAKTADSPLLYLLILFSHKYYSFLMIVVSVELAEVALSGAVLLPSSGIYRTNHPRQLMVPRRAGWWAVHESTTLERYLFCSKIGFVGL